MREMSHKLDINIVEINMQYKIKHIQKDLKVKAEKWCISNFFQIMSNKFPVWNGTSRKNGWLES